jgi:hypothetical protein
MYGCGRFGVLTTIHGIPDGTLLVTIVAGLSSALKGLP